MSQMGHFDIFIDKSLLKHLPEKECIIPESK